MERSEAGAHVLVRCGILLLEPARDGLQLRVGGLEGDAGREPRDGAHEVRAPKEILGANVWLPRAWQPDVDALEREGEPAGCDADDLQLLAIDADGAADGARIGAELFAPEAVGDHNRPHDAIGGPCLVRLQRASELSANAEDVEEVSGDARRPEHTRGPLASEGGDTRAVEEHRDILKGLHLRLPIEHVGWRAVFLVPALFRSFFPGHHQPFRLCERQWLE